MILIPAVDILGGRPVRLLHGEYDKVTRYGDSPLGAALRWKAAGVAWLHVVDLDGARSGREENGEAILEIVEQSGLRVQVAGGLRSLEDVARVLGWGAERAVVGTTAMRDPALLREMCTAFPGRIVVALDARGGEVATDGWTIGSGKNYLDAAREVAEAGVSWILFTSIAVDGTLSGPDLPAIRALQRAASVPIIASGGVGSVAHLEELSGTGVEAVVVGRALYEGTVPAEVLERYRAPSDRD